MVAQFRARQLTAHGPATRLSSTCSSAFGGAVRNSRKRWWREREIRGVAAGQKLLSHPKKGLLRFEYATFQANDDPALKLAIYTPAQRIPNLARGDRALESRPRGPSKTMVVAMGRRG